MTEQDKNSMIDRLCRTLINLGSEPECKTILHTLCSPGEMTAVAQRLEIARMIRLGASMSEIVDKTDASAYVVAKIRALLRDEPDGFLLALEKSELSYKQYADFAAVYDRLMQELDYPRRMKYILGLFRRFGASPRLVLDLACGTGGMTTLLAREGFEMIGVDISADMLESARQKAQELGLDILYLHQPMQKFELYGSVQAVLCLTDSLNYLTETEDVESTFRLIYNYLEPGGLFIFDVNTRYRLEHVLAGNVFSGGDEGVFYSWANAYDPEQEICEFTLDFFVKENTLYRRFTEIHHQRAFGAGELTRMLKKAGFALLARYDDLTLDAPARNSEKVFYIARKPGGSQDG